MHHHPILQYKQIQQQLHVYYTLCEIVGGSHVASLGSKQEQELFISVLHVNVALSCPQTGVAMTSHVTT